MPPTKRRPSHDLRPDAGTYAFRQRLWRLLHPEENLVYPPFETQPDAPQEQSRALFERDYNNPNAVATRAWLNDVLDFLMDPSKAFEVDKPDGFGP